MDDASTDDSASVARGFGVQQILLPQREGPAVARNTGARQASGDVILFLDADVCVHPDTVVRIATG